MACWCSLSFALACGWEKWMQAMLEAYAQGVKGNETKTGKYKLKVKK
jgi:hypothetical protein